MTLGKWYSKLFAHIYDPFMHKVEERVFARKRHSFLNQLEGTILDVGSGTGVNFTHFSAYADVIALEPNEKMLEYASKKLPVKANIELKLGGIGFPETNFNHQQFDYIIATLVLCTIPDPELALQQFKKWLKPDGKLILIEHIRSHNHIKGMAQDAFNPAWQLVADGCNLNRNTDQMVKDAGFHAQNENYFNLGFKWFEGVYTVS